MPTEPTTQQQQQQPPPPPIPRPLSPATTTTPPLPRTWLLTLLQSHNPSTTTTTHALTVAPMVDQSDLPFRLLCRNYGANLAYTPMIHSRMFLGDESYKKKFWIPGATPKEDRPLVAQFCGSDPETVARGARYLQEEVDAVDINCGCPQNIAKRGNYGAFLLEKTEVLLSLVRYLRSTLDVPVTVKVRLLPSGIEDSLNLYRALVRAGACLICVHGRNRHQKGRLVGGCDWEAIRRVVEDPEIGGRIPILANGGLECRADVDRCLKKTGADGVMSSEAILEYPAFFSCGPRIGRLTLARQYLELSRTYPPDEGGQANGIKCIRTHLHRILHEDLQQGDEGAILRQKISTAPDRETMAEVLDEVERIQKSNGHDVLEEKPSWYVRHSRMVQCPDSGVVKSVGDCKREKDQLIRQVHLIDEEESPEEGGGGLCFGNMFDEEVY